MTYRGTYPLTEGKALDRPLVPAYAKALHSNPSFEAVTAGVADDWDFFWQVGGSVAIETIDTVAGAHSLTVSTVSGASKDQVSISDPFDVANGDTIAVSAWARKVSGNPLIRLGLFTASSTDTATPTFFDGFSVAQEAAPETLPVDFTPYERQFVVPKGHDVARMYFRCLATATEATVSRIDFTSSERRGVETTDGGGWLPVTYGANWGDVGGAFGPFQYRRDAASGLVHLEGYPLRSGSTSSANAVIGTVAAGYRPPASVVVGHLANSGGTLGLNQVLLTAAGDVVASLPVTAGTALWVSADFYTD